MKYYICRNFLEVSTSEYKLDLRNMYFEVLWSNTYYLEVCIFKCQVIWYVFSKMSLLYALPSSHSVSKFETQ